MILKAWSTVRLYRYDFFIVFIRVLGDFVSILLQIMFLNLISDSKRDQPPFSTIRIIKNFGNLKSALKILKFFIGVRDMSVGLYVFNRASLSITIQFSKVYFC